MIPHRHLHLFRQTTKLLSSLLLFVLVFSCSPSKPAEESSSDTTVVEDDVPIEQQLIEEKQTVAPPDNGEWDGSLNYVLDIPKGNVDNKDIVVVIALDDEPGSAHYIVGGVDQDMAEAVKYVIRQPIVAQMLDTAEVYSEGLQQIELCFSRTVWYNIQFEDKNGNTVTGWIPDSPGVYSVNATNIGGKRFAFEGIQDSLSLGSMWHMELDMRTWNKNYDVITADNCREVQPLFFYNDKKIYFIHGELEDEWNDPVFNTTLSHLTLVNAIVDWLVVTPNEKGVQLAITKNSNALVNVTAQGNRLTLSK